MRNTFSLNQNWKFSIQDKPAITVDVPHTWNAIDGQDGGNDYYRGSQHLMKRHRMCIWSFVV